MFSGGTTYQVTARGNTVKGILHHSGIALKVSVANPKAWKTLLERYYHSKEGKKNLWVDLACFIHEGQRYNRTKKQGRHKDQWKKDALKLCAAVLYEIYKLTNKQKEEPTSKDIYKIVNNMNSVFKDFLSKTKTGGIKTLTKYKGGKGFYEKFILSGRKFLRDRNKLDGLLHNIILMLDVIHDENLKYEETEYKFIRTVIYAMQEKLNFSNYSYLNGDNYPKRDNQTENYIKEAVRQIFQIYLSN